MNFLQSTPFFRIFIALASGIILFQYAQLPLLVLLLLGILSLCVIIVHLFIKSSSFHHNYRWIFGVAVSLAFAVLGHYLCVKFELNDKFSNIGDKNLYQVELISSPLEKTNSYQCKVKLIQCYDSIKAKPASGKAIVYIQKDTTLRTLRIGDKLLIYAEFKSPDGVQNPEGFDYAKYLKRQGIEATAYISKENWKLSNEEPSYSIKRVSDQVRGILLSIYRQFGISGDEFAVLAALTLGYIDDLQPDLLQSYSATGAMHILSVSGLHVGIVFAVMAFLLKFLDKKPRTRFLKAFLIILFLWSYAFITGLSLAVMRAAFMFSFVSIAACFDRKSLIYNTVFMSATLMLFINPNALFDIGFQLSYSAVLSIVFFQPTISKWIYVKNKIGKWSWDLIAVSIAAQLGTAPFTLFYFHQFPNFFLLTNIVAIPLSTIVIYLAIALLIISKIPYLSVIIAFLLNWSVWLMNYLIVFIQNLPFSTSNISLNYIQLILSFVALFLIIHFFYNKKFIVLAIGLCSVLLISGVFFIQKINTLSTTQFIVYSDSRVPIINFIHQTKNYVYTTDSIHATKMIGNYWKGNLLDKPIFINKTPWLYDGFVFFHGKKLLILSDELLKNKQTDNPIEVDYIIISNKVKPKIKQILSCVSPKMIIVDKSISAWYTNDIKHTCLSNKIDFYSVAEKGAFIFKFQQ